jgi:hypothetical protein
MRPTSTRTSRLGLHSCLIRDLARLGACFGALFALAGEQPPFMTYLGLA